MSEQAVHQIQERLKAIQCMVGQELNDQYQQSGVTINAINKIHEKAKREKDDPKQNTVVRNQKLKGLYSTALEDAYREQEIIKATLFKIYEIRAIKNERRIQVKQSGNKETIRRGALMKALQFQAQNLPLWIGNLGESPPGLCGAIPAEPTYVASVGDMVAALQRSPEGDDNWILAEVVNYNATTNKYELDDIDEEQKEKIVLSKRRVIPLPRYRANPDTDPDSLFKGNTTVMALYPQTTCFYKALVSAPPVLHNDDYEVLFEDSSYSEGYSPPLRVAQRYVIPVKIKEKKNK